MFEDEWDSVTGYGRPARDLTRKGEKEAVAQPGRRPQGAAGRFSSTATLPELALAVTTSGRAPPRKSPTARPRGLRPRPAYCRTVWNVPSPLPRSTLTLLY